MHNNLRMFAIIFHPFKYNKTMNKKTLIIAIAAIGTFASCTKKPSTSTPTPSPMPSTPTPTPTPTPSTPVASGATTPTFSTGDGAIVALITRTTNRTPLGSYDVDLCTGIAAFGTLSTGTYVDAGPITLNNKSLKKQTNNTYVFTPTATNVIDLSNDINWWVSSPSFTYNAGSSVGRGMPEAGPISGSYTLVSTTSDFTLSVDGSIINADSVYYQINGSKKSLLKRVVGTVKSVTFSAAEMATLGAVTGGSVTICPWNHQLKTFGGKSIHVINELALSRAIEIK